MNIENLEGEIWKPVVGYEGLYEVSNLGRVKSLGRKQEYCMANQKGKFVAIKAYPEKLLEFKRNTRYVGFLLYKDGTRKSALLHRVVAQSFHPNPKNKSHVNHINGDKHDNRAENLEWATPKENTIHAHANNLASTRHLHKHNYQKGRKPTNGVLIIDIVSGVYYETLTEAAKVANLDKCTLRKYLKYPKTNKTNLRLA